MLADAFSVREFHLSQVAGLAIRTGDHTVIWTGDELLMTRF